MSNFTHIFLDLDGTLADNTRGITAAARYTLEKMNIEVFEGELPKGFIGPPLQRGLKEIFGVKEKDIPRAVEFFREYYSVNGLFENDLYPGVAGMIKGLYSSGKQLFIATSKLEFYASQICKYFGFEKYITQLKGADYQGKYSAKGMIIRFLLESQKLVPSKNMIMAGDTVFDIEGGRENGLATVAVTYGFGKRDELLKANPDYVAESVEELYNILL